MSADAATFESVTPLPVPTAPGWRLVRRTGWTAGVAALLAALVAWYATLVPQFGDFQIRSIVAGTMPLAMLAMGQAVIVLAGGIDLSIGAKMVFANCLSVIWMQDRGFAACAAIALAVIVITMAMSAFTGAVTVATGVPDIIITLAASFTIGGLAQFIIGGPRSGGNVDFQRFVSGGFSDFKPSVLWICGLLLVVWLPLRRSRTGVALYAIGSDRQASFLSGVAIGRTRVMSYLIGGFFAASAGIATTAYTGGAEPRFTIGNTNTLNSVAAVVLGGVALTGGVGGLVGPVIAALSLNLIPQIMLGLGWDPSNAETARGVVIILVVAIAGLLQTRRRAT